MEEPVEVTFQDLREMTDNFSKKRIVGKGGFGIVYKGVTKHGVDVAVKIVLGGSDPDLDFKQFQNEFDNLMKVKHDNIVQFLGYCYEIEPTHMEYNGVIVPVEEIHGALCFEYLHNGSLKNHLSDESSRLDWCTRYNIIKGICEGLRYIHETESLVHLDLKPDNILLDQNMVPKIADFGLSMIFGEELTRTTESLLGTPGFQPPELIDKGEISKKFDIFSLGVIIIKIVSGPEGYPKCQDMTPKKFIDQVKTNWRKRWKRSSNDSKHESAWCRQVETCTKVALLSCLEKDCQKRPNIVKIIDMLNETETANYEERKILQPPEDGYKTMCRMMTRHDKMELIEEHEVITDVGEDLIVGRDEEVNKITASLFESIKSAKMVILPIYGIGGIGKTTFAKLIFNHTNFKYYSHVWLHVSRRFDLKEIGKSIDSQLSGEENQANEQLISKEILIVLDDFWEDNPINIEKMKNLLYRGDNIEKVIVLVTTRTADIAKKLRRNIEPYEIQSLTNEMCWDIIKAKSGFKGGVHDKENEILVDIGKKIAQKCGGVALAAQTLGFMLRSINHDKWITVKDSDIWNETISEDTSLPKHVLASLKLSYAFSMDDFLKKCFTYCAIFPKGHKIVKHDLIYQWISLGFIIPTKIFSTLQLCEKYIVRLLGLSFLQYSTSAKTYQAYGDHDTVFMMHDLVHDLAVSLLGENLFDQSKQGKTGGSSYCYALLIDCTKPLESWTPSPAGLSAMRFLGCRMTELHGLAFESAASLRVLDLSQCSIQKFPDSIGRLKQLRYLNAPRIRDRMLPECITKLLNLRYLSLHGSCGILALPESIGEMEGLVHLDFSGCLGIKNLPETFGNLTSLEHVDLSNCKNVTGVSECLDSLTKLQHLNLSNCKNIGDLPRTLGNLTELQFLNLSDSSYLSGNKLAEAGFLGSLTKLKYLNLSSSNEPGIIVSPEALGSLTELKYLNLSHHYIMEELAASIGNLCNLEHLDMSYCSSRGDVLPAVNGLRKLQYLDFNCFRFDDHERLHEAFGNLRELRHLNLGRITYYLVPYQMNNLLWLISTLTNLEYLNLSRNDGIFSIESLANLKKLHTLDLSYNDGLWRLPASISEMDSLKFLYTKGCSSLDRSTLPHYASSSRIPPHFATHTGDGESSSYVFESDFTNPGWRKISRLENVKSAEDAQAIKLAEMTYITELALEWTQDAKRFVDDTEVLRELEPPYSLSEFHLEGYNSLSYPYWVKHIDAYLPDLTRIELSDLPSCNNLPPLGQLPNLKVLGISGMDNIKKIDKDLYGGTRGFPLLEQFVIVRMKYLEEWNTAYSSDEQDLNEPVFPCLRYVEIRHCPVLRIKPHPPRSIHALRVYRSDEVMLSESDSVVFQAAARCTQGRRQPVGRMGLEPPLPACAPLKRRGKNECEERKKERRGRRRGWRKGKGNEPLHSANPNSVTGCTVHVECCVVPLHQWSLLRHLPCLKNLRIVNCSDLTCSSPDFIRCLTSLESLTVSGCESIVSLPEWLGDLTSLMELQISDCKCIKTLPDSIRKLTGLQTLAVRRCENIVLLPERFGDLTSLTELEINDCNGIKTLPDDVQQLTCLKVLEIYKCPELISWCKAEENKTKLTHIKRKYFSRRFATQKDAEKESECDERLRDTTNFMDDTEVLNELEAPYSLSEILMEVNSLSYPYWVKRIDVYLPHLTRIVLSDLPSCNNLPPLGQLPNLKVLEISGMDNIKKIDKDVYGGPRGFPLLEKFVIVRMKCLEEWNTAYSSDEHDLNESVFPCLRYVEMRHCPVLRIKPHPPRSINTLRVYRSDRVMLSESDAVVVQKAGRCTLHVEYCVVPLHRWSLLRHLPCLKNLRIVNCTDLTCSSLDFLPCLTSLENLTVSGCESIELLPEWLGDLTSLMELHISDCKGIPTLPDCIQKLTCLQTLTVRRCESFMLLPERFGDLCSLKELEINACKGIRALPDSVQQLTRLMLLEIYKCPELVSWCKAEENKRKLAHIEEKYFSQGFATPDDAEIVRW